MSHVSLAIRYRPQSFAEVIGQDTIKTILSRAAAEDKVVPAYLLSGTRGVGKTTIARIFAKVLNCQNAPVSEPCNECEQCKHITKGIHVDVVEIDGASNRGIDDARRLRESIAYAPMEGRYKVFIIDEAHMLTRESFNALLKTLEEPPLRSIFIFATTEAHKFPITIISRCQHFVFKTVPEEELIHHLSCILKKEQLVYEEAALRLIARKAAGSIRDSLSLLGQTLAFSGSKLTESAVRGTLGLVDQSFYEQLVLAFNNQDYLSVVRLNQELLEQGTDLGFFLREFAALWRNLFLLRQIGEAAVGSLGLLPDEGQRLITLAKKFDPIYIHAAWQMVLENQRQLLTSLEPSIALELLFFNLTLLPNLVSLEQLSKVASSLSSSGTISSITVPMVEGKDLPSIPPEVNAQKVIEAPSVRDIQKKNLVTDNNKIQLDIGVQQVEEVSLEKVDVFSLEEKESVEETPSWEAFLAHCIKSTPELGTHLFSKVSGVFHNNELILKTTSHFQYEKILFEKFEILQQLLTSYIGEGYSIQVVKPKHVVKPESELKNEVASHPVIQALQQNFDAKLLRCTLRDDTSNDNFKI